MIKVTDLEFKRKNFSLNKLSFEIEDGMIVGLIGRNGSGKTTTIECLTDLLPIMGAIIKFSVKDYMNLQQKRKNKLALWL